MKNPDKKHPNVFQYTVLSIMPMVFLLLLSILPMIKCYDAGLQMNYSFAVGMVAASIITLYAIFIRLTAIAATYVWEYLALVKYLRQRGLENFIQEAKKIKSLS